MNLALRRNWMRTPDLEQLRKLAAEMEALFDSDFDLEPDRFTRKWTSLDLRSMANKRDELTDPADVLSSQLPLLPLYLGFYKTASQMVHAESAVISHRFFGVFSQPDGQEVLMPKPIWALIIASVIANLDIVQAYETLRFLGIEAMDEFMTLQRRWQELRDRFLGP